MLFLSLTCRGFDFSFWNLCFVFLIHMHIYIMGFTFIVFTTIIHIWVRFSKLCCHPRVFLVYIDKSSTINIFSINLNERNYIHIYKINSLKIRILSWTYTSVVERFSQPHTKLGETKSLLYRNKLLKWGITTIEK